jgi:DNA helicase-2/ATP-dependent DNA helicase PcrA
VNDIGDPIMVYEASDEGAEANFAAGQIISGSRGKSFCDYAVLYRTNAQSNALEYAFKRNGIPYRVIGGMRFFDRAEVKDMLAYLCVINNRNDDLRLHRIINNPPRGLGAKTIETADRLAQAEGSSLYTVVSDPGSYAPLEKSANKLLQFSNMIEDLAALLDDGLTLPEFYDQLMERSGYIAMLEAKPTEENKTRLENIRELKSSINAYVQNADVPTLAGFLEEIALYTDLEQYNEGDDAVVMMTMHSAKGLEFPNVFIVGFEDGLFPGMRAIGDREEMEEERRLCYVAITRAKKKLHISYARQRMLYGKTSASLASRFLREIPEDIILRKGGYQNASAYNPVKRYDDYVTNANRYQQIAKPKSYLSSDTQNTTYLELHKGDMVQHTAFGKGMVLSVLKMGNDALLEIAFDDLGTKKLMAKTASSHMKRL